MRDRKQGTEADAADKKNGSKPEPQAKEVSDSASTSLSALPMIRNPAETKIIVKKIDDEFGEDVHNPHSSK